MKISVITVTFNSEDTIRDTIESVLAQTHSDVEHIIIDGASTDGTMAVVNEYRDRVATIVSEPDQGIYDAMNKGIRLATGDVIGILNSDDFYESERSLEIVAEQFVNSPEADMVFGNIVFVHSDDLQKVVRFYNSGHFRSWKLRCGWMPPHPATYIKKSAYDQVGPYSLDYKIGADYEMFVRLLLRAGLVFKQFDTVLVRMRVGGVSTSGLQSTSTLNSEIVRACRSNGIYTNILFVISRLPFKVLELLRKPQQAT